MTCLPNQISEWDRLITRPNEPLPTPLDPKRPRGWPADPKEPPPEGQDAAPDVTSPEYTV